MNKIGLALSGGGFRASLYHLGLIRFLRDADILSQVTHITSVSGGSIIATHLALNWDRYNGSPEEFDAVASEFRSFVNLDIGNRIVRRFPLCIPLRVGRHYEKYLYGDTRLFELPEKPKLHILTTNLSEGGLCSFTRDGLLVVRRPAERKDLPVDWWSLREAAGPRWDSPVGVAGALGADRSQIRVEPCRCVGGGLTLSGTNLPTNTGRCTANSERQNGSRQ